jgi:hypothetical protein
VVAHCSYPTSMFCPTWIAFIWRRPTIETFHNNAHLPLRINRDAPAFITKGRRAPTTRDLYYPTNQRCAITNVHLPLVTEVGTSPILHKLRHAAKMLILFTFPASDPPSLMQTCLTLPDERRPPTGTSPIRVYD